MSPLNNELIVSSVGQYFISVHSTPTVSFFSRIPTSIRSRDYDRSGIMRLIHECMGIPASPPITSEDSEVDSDSPSSCSTAVPLPSNIPIAAPEPPTFNPQLIIIDERTMQLHFTPLYFGKRY